MNTAIREALKTITFILVVAFGAVALGAGAVRMVKNIWEPPQQMISLESVSHRYVLGKWTVTIAEQGRLRDMEMPVVLDDTNRRLWVFKDGKLEEAEWKDRGP